MRRRILVAIMAVATVAVLGFAGPLAIAVNVTYTNAVRLELQREATVATTKLPAGFPATNGPIVVAPADEGTSLAIYSGDGHLVSGTGPATADPLTLQALSRRPADGISGDDLVAAVPVADEENVIAVARAAEPTAVVQGKIWRARAIMVGLAAFVLLVAALIASYLSRRLSRPLDRLAENAQRLGSGDFTTRNGPSGIPEIDAAGEAMNRTATRLGRVVSTERAFSADVSHQLRTPITGLRLQLENALASADAHRVKQIEDALASVDRLERTVEDLIQLSREKVVAQPDADLNSVLVEVEQQWQRPLTEAGRRLAIRGPSDDGHIRVSGAALRQILAVLVGNSVEHGAGTVSVQARVTAERVEVDVADEGPGLAGNPEDAFRRRADADPNRGIGLALARSLAEAEGGGLTYAGAGTASSRFVLILRPSAVTDDP